MQPNLRYSHLFNVDKTNYKRAAQAQNILSEVFGEEYSIQLPEAAPVAETAKAVFDASNELKIVPNPTGGTPISIQLPDDVEDGGWIAIYDHSGKLVKQIAYGGEDAITLSVDDLPDGLYLCILRNKSNVLLARSKLAVIR